MGDLTNLAGGLADRMGKIQSGTASRIDAAESAGTLLNLGIVKIPKQFGPIDLRSDSDMKAQEAVQAMERMMDEMAKTMRKVQEAYELYSRPVIVTEQA